MNPLDELTYDPITGFFHWSVTRAPRCRYGARAGSLNRYGYLEIKVHGRRYMAHRLVWLLKYGLTPAPEIDHINGNRADNRICNLRLATRKQNAANVRRHSDMASGLKGHITTSDEVSGFRPLPGNISDTLKPRKMPTPHIAEPPAKPSEHLRGSHERDDIAEALWPYS